MRRVTAAKHQSNDNDISVDAEADVYRYAKNDTKQ